MGNSSDGRFGSSHQASSHQTTNLLQVLSEFVRNYVELSSVRESSRHVCFQLLQCNPILPEQEEHILQVGSNPRTTLLSAMLYGSYTYTFSLPNWPTHR
jgi:hypothetical protein